MSYVIINKAYCDNSKYCWFLRNCPQKVFSFANNKIEIEESKCIGCKICVGHCQVVMIAETEIEKNICIANLNNIEFHNNSDCKVFGTEPFSIDNMYNDHINDTEQINSIKKFLNESNDNLLIELSCNNALICRYAGIPFKTLQKVILEENIEEFKHKIIFTGSNKEAFLSFCDFFEISQNVISRAPLLIFYRNKQVYGIIGHGPIHFKNFDEKKFREEIKKIGENYANKRN